MNILFISLGHISKYRGGIDRVTDSLANGFKQKGHNIWYVSVWQPAPGEVLEANQTVLPDRIDISKNVHFLNGLITNNKIDIIINQSDQINL